MRMLRLFVVIVITALALVSMMFLIMVRVSDPLMPRAIFGVSIRCCTSRAALCIRSRRFRVDESDRRGGSVYVRRARVQEPAAQEHRLQRDWFDLAYLAVFSIVAMTSATLLFKRTL
jgi:ABC-2 type transport system permease protein